MWATPEGRELILMWRALRGKPGRPHGSTEGYTRKKRTKVINVAKQEAKEIVSYMEQKGYEIPQQEYAREAIETSVQIMRRKDINPKDQLAAARTILEWTKAKPASESTVNVRSAESFLEDIAAEMEANKAK